jgi:cytosine/creatinine deaminase
MPVDLILRKARLRAEVLSDIGIDGERIVSIGPSLQLEARNEIDLAGLVVLPGLVDLHQHLDKAYTYDVLGGGDGLEDAIVRMRAYKTRLTPEDVYDRGEQVLRRLACHGTCAIRSHVDLDHIAGTRGVEGVLALKRDWADRIRIQVVAFTMSDASFRTPADVALVRRALDLGCDVIGGVPSLNSEPRPYVDGVLRLAKEYDCLVDLHVDETGIPDASVLEYVAEATLREGLVGRVTCSHCCSLSVVDDATADRVIERVHEAGITICACPLTNLYLQGGGGGVPGFRGLTRVRDLWQRGVGVACASDNIRDPFNAYGNGDLLLAALIAGLACRLGSATDQLALLETISSVPAAAMALSDYGVREGNRADLVALDCRTLESVVSEQPARCLVLLGGQPVVCKA